LGLVAAPEDAEAGDADAIPVVLIALDTSGSMEYLDVADGLVIGRVLARIDALGLREETIVIFQSDHGHSTEARAFYGGGSSGPYRGAKFSLLEGGIRVPAAIRWPGRVPAGEARGPMVTGCDWFPTIAHYCGVALDDDAVDGRSLHRVIRSGSAESPHAEFHWGNERYWAVRVGRWKLIANARETTVGRNHHDEEGLALYDVMADPGERNNRAAEEPAVVADLLERHEGWWESNGASR
ncbi:MAG: sulfatase-like hydrolase/transferase, partial [Planctomycetota bacterium]